MRRPSVSVHEPLEAAEEINGLHIIARQELHHHDSRQFLRRVDPEVCVKNARPAQASGTAHFRIRWFRFDLKAESELVLAGAERKRPWERPVRGQQHVNNEVANLIRHHHADRRPADKVRRAAASAIQKELKEGYVV